MCPPAVWRRTSRHIVCAALADKHEGAAGKQAATDAFQLLSEAFKAMVASGAANGR